MCNSNRQQEYQELFKKILDLARENKQDVTFIILALLSENITKCDSGFVDFIQAKAKKYKTDNLQGFQGCVDFCEYVVKVANEAQRIDSYLKFLYKSLRLVQEHITSGDESYLEKLCDLLYEVLNDNLEFITFDFNQLLKTSAVSDLQKDSIPNFIVGGVYSTFGRLVLDFPLGDTKVKVDIAITGHEVMAQFLSEEEEDKEIFPEGKNKILATTQELLGDLYSRRELDSKIENLDRAINYYKSALDIYSLEGHSDVWAKNKYKLGGCYLERAVFSPKDFELANQCFESAIQFHTRENYPLEWARLKVVIGDIFCEKLSENKAENIEAAIECYIAASEVFVHVGNLVGQVKALHHLGIAYSERIIGETWENTEKSIFYYKQALIFQSKDEDLCTWFNIQHCLAKAYSSKNGDKKSEGIEDAITILEEILQINSLEISSKLRMSATMELGLNYCNRIIGNHKENNNKAFTNLTLASEFFNSEVSLLGWLQAQLNLGYFYGKLADKNQLENIETSISILEAAIKKCDLNLFPEIWIHLHINLAINYKNRILGDVGENIERAICIYNSVLNRFSWQPHLLKLKVILQWNLGITHVVRSKHLFLDSNKSQGVQVAIQIWRECLTFLDHQSYPWEWAAIQNLLGNAYIAMGMEEDAIQSYTLALQVRTPKNFHRDWAMTVNNLGLAYGVKIRKMFARIAEGGKVYPIQSEGKNYMYFDDLDDEILGYFHVSDKYIKLLESALEVREFQFYPDEWAQTQNNLGVAYYDSNFFLAGTLQEKIDKCFAAFRAALSFHTPTTYPLECFKAGSNFGSRAFNLERWIESIEGFSTAIEAAEQSRFWAMSNSRRQEILSEAIGAYEGIILAFIKTNKIEKALEYVERSKSRNLVDLLIHRDLYPQDVSPAICKTLDKLRQLVRTEQIRIDTVIEKQKISLEPQLQQIDRSQLEKIQQKLNEFIKTEIEPVDPYFNLTQKVKPISFVEIQSLIPDAQTVIVEWYFTEEMLLTFIITQQSINLIQVSNLDSLNICIDEYLTHKPRKDLLKEQLYKLSEQLRLQEVLKKIQQFQSDCTQVILIPHRSLHLIPLHALPLPNESDRYWMDIFSRGIRYAPSCQLLQLTKHHASDVLTRLFAIQDPRQDLPFANSVVASARRYFEANGSRSNDIKILIGKDATKEAFDIANDSGDLESLQCLLFSGHGSFNEKSPLQSKLMLAEGTSLTLSDIFSLRFQQCRLVVLSACETGLIDRTSISDEYVGLPSGFLFAGSSSIVSSLWEVSSISTTLLIREFYKNIFKIISLNQDFYEGDVAKALCLAQKWLRQASTKECEAALKEVEIQARSEYSSLPPGKQELYTAFLDKAYKQVEQATYPFSDPYYWAAFTAIGF